MRVANIADTLRSTFESGSTRPLAWRRHQLEQMNRMLTENEKHKAKALAEKEKERLEDVRAQEEYARMLDKQE